MLYNSILMALTATQVLAQDQYNSDVLSSYMSVVAGSTPEPSPTVVPYVTTGSDGQTTTISSADESGNTSTQTDTSTTAMPNESVNYDSTVSSAATSEYTSEYTSDYTSYYTSDYTSSAATSDYTSDYTSSAATSDYTSSAAITGTENYQSESSSSSSTSANAGQTATPLSPPIAWQHIKYRANTDKCLAVFDTSGNPNTPVVVVDCFSSGHEAHWLVDVTGAGTIISRAFNDTNWCLDSGESQADGQPVYLNKCEGIVVDQLWQYADEHLIVYSRPRCLDLKLGQTEGGGRLQTWVFKHENTNQGWTIEPAVNANT